MANNLNPGADATLVGVAYRAAMANTPADYSDTLENVAEGYEKTMEASSEMWDNIAAVGAALGGEMVKNANERATMAAKVSTLNAEDAEFLMKEIYGLKDAQKELGFLPGVFGDRETKMDLAKLKMDQQELFAEIDLAAESIKVGTDAVASGAFDTSLSMDGGEMVNAIIKSGLKNTVTDNQNVAKLGRNEYGELMYTLYNTENNPDGEVLMGADGKPRTMTIKQFNEAIATNVDDKGAKANVFDTYNDQVAKRGLESRTGVYDEQMKAMDSNWLDKQLEKPVDLKRAMHMKFGYMETSFFDDITKNQNQYSAELYADLLKATGGNVLTGSIVDGIEDVGEPGINEVELKNSQNYQVLTANLLGMKDPEVTKAYFKDYVLKEFKEANNYGHRNKPPTEPIEPIEPTSRSLFGRTVPIPATAGERESLALVQNIAAGKSEVVVNDVTYEWDPKTEMYSFNTTKEADGEVSVSVEKISREKLIQRSSELYGSIPNDYFTTGMNTTVKWLNGSDLRVQGRKVRINNLEKRSDGYYIKGTNTKLDDKFNEQIELFYIPETK